MFHSERQYRRISEGASIRYERLMEKMMEEIERQEDEQERKRSRGADGKMAHSNLTDEEKRNKIHAEVIKRMEGISGARKVALSRYFIPFVSIYRCCFVLYSFVG